jgi:hypothetical protein
VKQQDGLVPGTVAAGEQADAQPPQPKPREVFDWVEVTWGAAGNPFIIGAMGGEVVIQAEESAGGKIVLSPAYVTVARHIITEAAARAAMMAPGGIR